MKLIIASNNEGKIKEYKEILELFGYDVISQKEAGIDIEIPETGTSYRENALLKAEGIYKLTKTAVLSDDSGLSIDFLNGGPGLYSARFKSELSQKEKNQYILNEMKDTDNRKAKFVCSICFIFENGEKIEVQGICPGKISRKIEGERGFGYDPIFIPDGYDKTFSDIGQEEKNKISHRALAIKELIEKLKSKN